MKKDKRKLIAGNVLWIFDQVREADYLKFTEYALRAHNQVIKKIIINNAKGSISLGEYLIDQGKNEVLEIFVSNSIIDQITLNQFNRYKKITFKSDYNSSISKIYSLLDKVSVFPTDTDYYYVVDNILKSAI